MTNPCTLYGESAIKGHSADSDMSPGWQKISEEVSNTRGWQKILIRLSCVSAIELQLFFFFFNSFSSKYENVLFQKHSNWQNGTVTTHIHTTRVHPLTLHSVSSCSYPQIHLGCSVVAQSYPTFCNPMDYSLPGFSVHGILQARILE